MTAAPAEPAPGRARRSGEPDRDRAESSAARRALAILVVVQALNFLDRYVLTVMLEPIKAELGVSDTAMGFLTGTAFAIFYTLAGIPLARWADRGVRRTVIAVSLATWSVMTAVCGLARSFGELALARVGVGIGEAGSMPASHSLISDLFPPARRATALAVLALGNQGGMLLGLVLGGWLTQVIGWRATFFVLGPPGVLLALLVVAALREPERGRLDGTPPAAGGAVPVREAFAILWRLPTFRAILLATAACSFTGYGLATWMPAFLMRAHGTSTAEAGLWLGVGGTLFSAAGMVAGARIADALSARDLRWSMWVPAIGLLLALPFHLGFLLVPSKMGALLCMLPGGLLGMAWGPASFAAVQGLAPPHVRALAAAIVMLVTNLVGVGGGPQVVGLLNDLLAPSAGDAAVRYSLAIVQVGSLVAALLYLRAAATIRADMGRATARV